MDLEQAQKLSTLANELANELANDFKDEVLEELDNFRARSSPVVSEPGIGTLHRSSSVMSSRPASTKEPESPIPSSLDGFGPDKKDVADNILSALNMDYGDLNDAQKILLTKVPEKPKKPTSQESIQEFLDTFNLIQEGIAFIEVTKKDHLEALLKNYQPADLSKFRKAIQRDQKLCSQELSSAAARVGISLDDSTSGMVMTAYEKPSNARAFDGKFCRKCSRC